MQAGILQMEIRYLLSDVQHGPWSDRCSSVVHDVCIVYLELNSYAQSAYFIKEHTSVCSSYFLSP